jgi:hypothetical protein
MFIKFDEAYEVICKEFGIKATKYAQTVDVLAIAPTKEDLMAHGHQMRLSNGEMKVFKKTSKPNSRWVALCKERELEIPAGMKLIDYFHMQGQTRSSVILIDEVLYCLYETQCDFKDSPDYVLPEGFEEIKASEYYKAIEDYTERCGKESK